jgi:hypothetical protein
MVINMEHFYKNLGGWANEDWIELLRTMLQSLKGRPIKVAEIGVLQGRGTAAWLVELLNSGMEFEYHAIDNWSDPSSSYEVTVKNLSPVIEHVNILKIDSNKAADLFSDGYFDIVYIDALHDYESIRSDIACWLPKVKIGGYLSGDDYVGGWPGVIKAVDEKFGDKVKKIGYQQWMYLKETEQVPVRIVEKAQSNMSRWAPWLYTNQDEVDESLKSMRKLICIACSSNSSGNLSDRLECLHEVMKNYLENYGEVKLIVDVNDERILKFIKNNFDSTKVETILNTNLEHPYHLVWLHRQHFVNNLEAFDYFTFVEDDMFLPYKSFCYYVKTLDLVWPKRFPGFVRLETKNDKLFNVDAWVTTNVSSKEILEVDGDKFADKGLHSPHQAMWMIRKEYLRSLIKSPMFIRKDQCIETATNPLSEFGKTQILKLNSDYQIHKDCWVYHLTNRFVDNEGWVHGKLPIENTIKVEF